MEETNELPKVDVDMEYAMDSETEEPEAAQTRSRLLVLMGFPAKVDDDTEKYEEVQDDEEEDGNKGRRARWRKVLTRLISNPEEASICDDGKYPLDDALWVQTNPVPVDVFIRLIRTFPQAFTSQTYAIACNNPNTRPKVMKLLRGADVEGDIAEQRSALVQLMGFPKFKWDNNYTVQSVKPKWAAVRNRLITHPGEAKIDEDGCFPLADALWIKSEPVPFDIVKTMIEICPESLTDQAFANASHHGTDFKVLRLMFSLDKKPDELDNSSPSDDSYVKVN